MKAKVKKNPTNAKTEVTLPEIGDYQHYTPARLKSRRKLPTGVVHRIDGTRQENEAGVVKLAYVENGQTVKLSKKQAVKAVAAGRLKDPDSDLEIVIS